MCHPDGWVDGWMGAWMDDGWMDEFHLVPQTSEIREVGRQIKQHNLSMWEGSFLIRCVDLRAGRVPEPQVPPPPPPLTPGLPHKHVVGCLVLPNWAPIGENWLPVCVLSRVHWFQRSVLGSCRQRRASNPHTNKIRQGHERNVGWWRERMDVMMMKGWISAWWTECVFHRWRGRPRPKPRLRWEAASGCGGTPGWWWRWLWLLSEWAHRSPHWKSLFRLREDDRRSRHATGFLLWDVGDVSGATFPGVLVARVSVLPDRVHPGVPWRITNESASWLWRKDNLQVKLTHFYI